MLLILEQRLGFFPVFWAFTSTSCLHCLVISNFFATSSTNYARPLSLHFLQSRDLLVVCTKLIAAALSKPFWEASIIPPYTSSPFCFFELKSSPLAHLIDWLLTALPVQSDIVVPNLRINPYGTILDIRFPCQQSASYISKVYYAIHNHVALQVNIVILTYVALPWLVGCLFWRPWIAYSMGYWHMTYAIKFEGERNTVAWTANATCSLTSDIISSYDDMSWRKPVRYIFTWHLFIQTRFRRYISLVLISYPFNYESRYISTTHSIPTADISTSHPYM